MEYITIAYVLIALFLAFIGYKTVMWFGFFKTLFYTGGLALSLYLQWIYLVYLYNHTNILLGIFAVMALLMLVGNRQSHIIMRLTVLPLIATLFPLFYLLLIFLIAKLLLLKEQEDKRRQEQEAEDKRRKDQESNDDLFERMQAEQRRQERQEQEFFDDLLRRMREDRRRQEQQQQQHGGSSGYTGTKQQTVIHKDLIATIKKSYGEQDRNVGEKFSKAESKDKLLKHLRNELGQRFYPKLIDDPHKIARTAITTDINDRFDKQDLDGLKNIALAYEPSWKEYFKF